MSCVIGLSHGIFIGHLLGLNKVSAPKFNSIDAAHTSRLIHESLYVEDGLRATRTSVSACGCGVCHHCGEVKVNQTNVINAGLNPRSNQDLNGHSSHAGIGPNIGSVVDAKRQDFPACIKRHFSSALNISAVGAGEKVFASFCLPFHRNSQVVSAKSNGQILCVGSSFHAKTAPHITDNDANILRRNAKKIGNLSANCSGHL